MFESEHAPEHSHGPPLDFYITVTQLHKILGEGWSRSNVYYWLNRCKIQVVDIAGHKFVPIPNLPTLVMTLKKAKEEAHARRSSER